MHQTRAHEIQEQIETILRRDWDPLGAGREPACSGEYHCYVAGVYRMLVNGADAAEVAEHLARKEQREMGFTTRGSRLMEVARRLKEIDVTLHGLDP